MTPHPGFTLNGTKGRKRLKALREQREITELAIERLHDQLYIIDNEIVELGGPQNVET